MPFTPEEFRSRHNKKLKFAEAKKAADIANALLKQGMSEGEAIAIANKQANTKHKKLHEWPTM